MSPVITVTFAFTGNPYDNFKIFTRTNSTTTNNDGVFNQGIIFQVQMQTDTESTANNISIQRVNYPGLSPTLVTATYPILLGHTYTVRAVDDGTNLSFYVVDLFNPILTTTDTSVFYHQVGFEGREGSGAGSGISAGSQETISNIVITTPSRKLLNISTRGNVGTGNNVLIGGFAVENTGPETILLRAVGPGLAAAAPSLAGSTLVTPQLTVFDNTGAAVATNVGWGNASTTGTTSIQAIIRPATVAIMNAVGAFSIANGSADCAILLTLPPGNYTVQVSGAGTSTGLAIVEAYEVP